MNWTYHTISIALIAKEISNIEQILKFERAAFYCLWLEFPNRLLMMLSLTTWKSNDANNLCWSWNNFFYDSHHGD